MAFVTAILLAGFLPLIFCQIIYHHSHFMVDPRIVGGRPALDREAPYQLSLMGNGRHFCGATLVTSPTSRKQVVITAGHCVGLPNSSDLIPPTLLTLRGGTLEKYGGQVRNVESVIRHEAYSGVIQNDIAILFLEHPFDVNDHLKPVDLPTAGQEDETTHLTVSGWGHLMEGGGLPDTLQIVKVPVIPNDLCAAMYSKIYQGEQSIFETSICAGEALGGHDACQGDSGGPAIGEDVYGLYLAGVVSWGEGCAQPSAPGVYTRVSKFIPWIATKTKAHESKQAASRNRRRKLWGR